MASRFLGTPVILVLLATSVLAPLKVDEWEKLVCALFTGTRFFDESGQLLFHPPIPGASGHLIITDPILRILLSHSNDGHLLKNMLKDPGYLYFPDLTAALAVTLSGFGEVFFSDYSGHAEQKVMALGYPPGYLISIMISFSPCNRCTQKILEQYRSLLPWLRPVIRFGWVYKFPDETHSFKRIRQLLQKGFEVQALDSSALIYYLLEHAPNDEAREALRFAVWKNRATFKQRDQFTQHLIDQILAQLHKEAEEEHYPYLWPGWKGTGRRDDDDEGGAGPGAGGSAAGGGSAYGTGAQPVACAAGSSSGDSRESSSIRSRGTRQQTCWDHISVECVIKLVMGLWLLLFILSILLELFSLLKVGCCFFFFQQN